MQLTHWIIKANLQATNIHYIFVYAEIWLAIMYAILLFILLESGAAHSSTLLQNKCSFFSDRLLACFNNPLLQKVPQKISHSFLLNFSL